MDNNLSLLQKASVEVENYPKVAENWVRFQSLFGEYSIYVKYIVFIFILTVLILAFRMTLKWGFQSARSRLPRTGIRADLWERFHQEDEGRHLRQLQSIFENEQHATRGTKENFMPVGFSLFQQVVSGVQQGLGDRQISKLVTPSLSNMDIMPLIGAIRSFRDLAARKILSEKVRNKRDYARALKDLSSGRPNRAVQLLQRELIIQEKGLFNLKNKLLQQYAKKEAAHMAMDIALITGFYDVKLADSAYRRAMELVPKESKNTILFGRFRQRTHGDNDRLALKAFATLSKEVDKGLEGYMLEYAGEMIQKADIHTRQEEIRARIADEKERYNEAVRVERLKIRETMQLERIKSLTDEARSR